MPWAFSTSTSPSSSSSGSQASKMPSPSVSIGQTVDARVVHHIEMSSPSSSSSHASPRPSVRTVFSPENTVGTYRSSRRRHRCRHLDRMHRHHPGHGRCCVDWGCRSAGSYRRHRVHHLGHHRHRKRRHHPAKRPRSLAGIWHQGQLSTTSEIPSLSSSSEHASPMPLPSRSSWPGLKIGTALSSAFGHPHPCRYRNHRPVHLGLSQTAAISIIWEVVLYFRCHRRRYQIGTRRSGRRHCSVVGRD